MLEILALVFVCVALFYASYTDILSRQISNLTCFAIVCIWLASSAVDVSLGSKALIYVCQQAVMAICLLIFLLLICYVFETLTGKTSFGGGDIKLISACALFFNLTGLLIFLLLACFLGIISSLFIKDRQTGFPFAPAISLSFVIVFLALNIFRII